MTPFDVESFTETAAALVAESDEPETPVERLVELIDAATVPEQRRASEASGRVGK